MSGELMKVLRILFRFAVARLAQPIGPKANLILHPKGEFISDQIRSTGRHYEIERLIWVKNNLDYSGFVDVGANIGNHSNFFLGLGSTVSAFEPARENFKLLELNCPGAECHNIALSDMETMAELITFPSAMGNSALAGFQGSKTSRKQPSSSSEIVRTKRLDSFHIPHPTLIKVDVEGSEFSVLKGAQKTLERHKPSLWVEIHNPKIRHSEDWRNRESSVLDWLSSLGYRLVTVLGKVDNILVHEGKIGRTSGSSRYLNSQRDCR